MSKPIRLHHFGGKEVPRTEELDISQPDAGEVLVSMRAASVNPVDFQIRSGKYPAVKNDRLPYTLGRDISGTIEKCGATPFKVGDEVFGMMDIHGGGYAQQAVMNQDAIAAKRPGLDHVHATAIPLAGLTAWQGLFKHGRLKEGSRYPRRIGRGWSFRHPVCESRRRPRADDGLDGQCKVCARAGS
jgi:NADPH:quinone reductase-like Zn-dependent oxidoreductase